MEIELSAWINEKRYQEICISKSIIRQQAFRVKAFENNANEKFTFKASDGWFIRFFKTKLVFS